MLRIGILTSGGDCQALNAAMRGVIKGLSVKRNDLEIYGFRDGYKGLIYDIADRMTPDDFSGILNRGGTILGTSRQPFKKMRIPDENGLDKVGHVTLQSGIAGGADVILLPEIPYDIDKVAEVVENRFAAGKKFSIIAVAEGAISKEDAKLKKKQYKAKLAERRYPSVAYEIAAALEEKTNREIRVTVPGHTQRGGAPCAYDRVLATRVGAYAAELILNKEYGYMVGIVDGDTKKVPLSEVAGKLKYVDPKCQMIKDAKTIGISFGE